MTDAPKWKEEHAIAILDGHAEMIRMMLDDAAKSWIAWYEAGRQQGKEQNQAEGKFNLYCVAACHSVEIALKTLIYQDNGRTDHPDPNRDSQHQLMKLYSRLEEDTKEKIEIAWAGRYDEDGNDVGMFIDGTPLFRGHEEGDYEVIDVIREANSWSTIYRFEFFEKKLSYEELYGHRHHLSDLVQILRLVALDRSPQVESSHARFRAPSPTARPRP